jgi:transposase InsO family protein
LSRLFEVLDISKQSFYQMLKRRRYKYEEQEQLIPLINEIRRDHPRMSARDIYLKLQPCCMGRDQFERFCMDSGYRIKQLRNFRVTTNSLGVTRFPNMIKDTEVTRVNQVFVSDITYFDIGPRTYYLTFMMDLYNREIVGWSASDNLRTESTTLPALHRLITERGRVNIKGAIIHSDGGGQYYCKEFKALTKDLEMINSMTEEKVYENSHAERLNGIIKNNYLYPYGPRNMETLKRLLDKAVFMYNTGKPHKALRKMTPSKFRATIDKENNSSSYLPLSTVNNINYKRSKSNNKKVNVI